MPNKDPIPQSWIKQYVDQLLVAAQKFDDGPMRDAALRRADHAMDLVKAWRKDVGKDRLEKADV